MAMPIEERVQLIIESWANANTNERDTTESIALEATDLSHTDFRLSSLGFLVPITYKSMFRHFSQTTLNLEDRDWMEEVLSSMDSLVKSFDDRDKMTMELDALHSRLSGYTNVSFQDHKFVMLASLRTLCVATWKVPNEVAWGTFHEVLVSKNVDDIGTNEDITSCVRADWCSVNPQLEGVGDNLGNVCSEPCNFAASFKKNKWGFFSPVSFPSQCLFVAACTGYEREWFVDVIESLDRIVATLSGPFFNAECKLLALRIHCNYQIVDVKEFKHVMLGGFRSSITAEWCTRHEIVWNWFWTNVEKQLEEAFGHLAQTKCEWTTFFNDLDGDAKLALRNDACSKWSAEAPCHLLAEQPGYIINGGLFDMTVLLFREPMKVAADIHTQFPQSGISIELLNLFQRACVEALSCTTEEEDIIEAFEWCSELICNLAASSIMFVKKV